jgi:hypothetical protein
MHLRLPAVDALIPVFRQELHPAVAGSVLLRPKCMLVPFTPVTITHYCCDNPHGPEMANRKEKRLAP